MGFLDFLFGNKEKSFSKQNASEVNSSANESRTANSTEKRQNNTSVETPRLENIIGRYYTLDQIRQVPMGQIRLQPIDAHLVVDTASQLAVSTLAKISPAVKKYLPNLDFSSPDAVAKYFNLYYKKIELGYEFGYAIKMGDDGYIGFIFIHTPYLNKKAINFPNWTIDFCLFSPFENQGIMIQSIARVLYILKSDFNVENVYAYVDERNSKCLKLLSRLPFDLQPETLTDPSTGHKAKLFCCPIHEINFKHC